MKKGIIFVGPRDSGKSKKAVQLANSDQFSEIVWMDGRRKSSLQDAFRFQNCTKDTDLVIIDDFPEMGELDFFFNAITGHGLKVNKRGQDSFYIKPSILIICDSYVTMDSLPKGRSFTARFDVYEFPHDGEIEFKVLESGIKVLHIQEGEMDAINPKIIITTNKPLP